MRHKDAGSGTLRQDGGFGGCARFHRIRGACIRIAAAILLIPPAAALAQVGTRAGTVIRNVADAAYVADGRPLTARSNMTATVLDERLDVVLTPRPAATDDRILIAFTLTNRGTGTEPFVLAAAAIPPGLVAVAFAADADRDGRPDAGGTLPDGRTAPIAPGDGADFVLILAAGAGGAAADGSVTITAQAATGSGAPGTVFAGRGDGGGDAVTGPTGGAATLIAPVETGQGEGSIEKSQAVRAPDGSARGMAGAVVTYTLRARPAAGARDARVDDPIPAGTRYVGGSLRLDGAAISDADDGDPGDCDGAHVTMALPDGGGPARTISFQVIIQ